MEGREPRPISPAEVEMIGQAFEQLLAEYRIPRESQEADDLAARLSGWAPARESSFAQPLRFADSGLGPIQSKSRRVYSCSNLTTSEPYDGLRITRRSLPPERERPRDPSRGACEIGFRPQAAQHARSFRLSPSGVINLPSERCLHLLLRQSRAILRVGPG
jgi:hypothetical protein